MVFVWYLDLTVLYPIFGPVKKQKQKQKPTQNNKTPAQKHTHKKPNSIASRLTGVRAAHTHAIQPKIALATGHGKA